jgi:adenylate cyclase
VLAGDKPYLEGMKESLELARRAIRFDNASGEVLATGASCEAMCGGSFELSEQLVVAALRANPNSIQVLMLCAGAFALAGETERAIELYQTAWRINPIDPLGFLIMRGLGIADFFERRFDGAATWERRVLGQHSDDAVARRYLAASLAHLGRIQEAKEIVSDLLRLQPNSSLSRSRRSAFKHQWMSDLYVEGLRLAGLPEGSL